MWLCSIFLILGAQVTLQLQSVCQLQAKSYLTSIFGEIGARQPENMIGKAPETKRAEFNSATAD